MAMKTLTGFATGEEGMLTIIVLHLLKNP